MRLILLKSVKKHSARIKIPPIPCCSDKNLPVVMIILLTRMQVFLINSVIRVVPFPPPPPLSLLKRQLYSTVCVGSHVVIARRSMMWTNQFMVYCCISGMFHFQVLGLSCCTLEKFLEFCKYYASVFMIKLADLL